MKKFLTTFLIFLFAFMNISPIFAEESLSEPQYLQEEQNNTPTEENNTPQEPSQPFVAQVEDDTIYLDPKSVYTLEFESDLDINETPVNEEIFFRLASPVKASNGMLLPEHTRFSGKFKKISKSKPMFKRARAYIIIDKIIFPNEKTYTVRMEPKKGCDLKSSQALNTLRAIPAGVGIITFSLISAATVAIESVSVVGLVVVPRTCKGFGILISSMAKGLNYKAKAGSQIEFKLDTPTYVTVSDLQR